MNSIKISASATTCTIDIEGTIGVDESSGSATTYKALKEQIEKIKEVSAPLVVVNIRSAGGDVNDALLIYEALSELDAHITTRCFGYTASAATIIAQAANEGCREIASTALYLIHNCSCATEGNAAEIEKQVELLKLCDSKIADIYATRSGKSREHFTNLMNKNNGNGEWLSAEQALEAGLADTIITADTATSESLISRIASWLGLKRDETKGKQPKASASIKKQELLSLSLIALDEGQRSASESYTKEVEDPKIEGCNPKSNAAAYNRDVAAFH